MFKVLSLEEKSSREEEEVSLCLLPLCAGS